MKNIIKIIIFNIFFLLSFNVSSESSNIYVIETNRGNISIEVYPEKAPTTVRNFQNYVEKEFYNGLIFHRIIPNFMIQGGGFDKNMMQKKTNDPIKNESNNYTS